MSNGSRHGNRTERDRATEVRDHHDHAAAEPVDPHAGRKREQQERQELDRSERSDLKRGCVQGEERHERKRDAADLRPELADRLRRPELQEIGMAPEAATRPGWDWCAHQLLGSSTGAGARASMMSPLTVFARTSTIGASSVGSPPSSGASARSNSELVEPLTVFASM